MRDDHPEPVLRNAIAAAPRPAPAKPETIVTLVHGTFARGTAWCREGSALRRFLADALRERCGEVRFDVFEWCGRNSHKARIRAGYELAEHIRELRRTHPNCRHFIVAHSHGGNIALFAHKHLPETWHAMGVATLATPFIRAELDDRIAGKSLEELRADAARHTGTLSGFLAWGVGIPTALIVDHAFGENGGENWYWTLGAAILAGVVTGKTIQFGWPPLARFGHRFSGRRAAARLARAVALEPMEKTHVLSFIYPGDEAGRLLDALEAITVLPSRLIRWVKEHMKLVNGLFWVVLIATSLLVAMLEDFIAIDGDAVGDVLANFFAYFLTTGIIVLIVLSAFRYWASFLRGHPWGFGWERPSMHAYVDVMAEPAADIPRTKSYLHQEVPFTESGDKKGGLRHSGLYDDPRVLKALAYWMTHVR